VTEYVDPTGEQVKRLAESSDDSPIIMLNLLRFKQVADGPFEGEDVTGREAYERYAEAVAPCLDKVGGRIAFAIDCAETVIGADGEWDLCAGAEYPSRAAFLEMIADPAFGEAHPLRTGALADSRLIAGSRIDV
jgi:uncharacterized protein (DUF1330 family)